MNLQQAQILRTLRLDTFVKFMRISSFLRNFLLCQLGFAVVCALTFLLFFNYFMKTLIELILTLTDAHEEVISLLDVYIKGSVFWLWVLFCLYIICCLCSSVALSRQNDSSKQSQAT